MKVILKNYKEPSYTKIKNEASFQLLLIGLVFFSCTVFFGLLALFSL